MNLRHSLFLVLIKYMKEINWHVQLKWRNNKIVLRIVLIVQSDTHLVVHFMFLSFQLHRRLPLACLPLTLYTLHLNPPFFWVWFSNVLSFNVANSYHSFPSLTRTSENDSFLLYLVSQGTNERKITMCEIRCLRRAINAIKRANK